MKNIMCIIVLCHSITDVNNMPLIVKWNFVKHKCTFLCEEQLQNILLKTINNFGSKEQNHRINNMNVKSKDNLVNDVINWLGEAKHTENKLNKNETKRNKNVGLVFFRCWIHLTIFLFYSYEFRKPFEANRETLTVWWWMDMTPAMPGLPFWLVPRR